MAKGVVHLAWWKRILPFSIFVSLLLMWFSPLFGIMVLVGYLMGEPVLSADLDHQNITRNEYSAMRRFGCLGAIWVGYWQPYGFLFSHRSFWSHFPFVSDLIRLSYLLVIPAALWIYYQIPINNTVLVSLFGVTIGLSMSTTVHYLLDM